MKITIAAFAVIAVSSAFILAANAEEKELPLVFEENFEKGAGEWQPTDADAWKITKTENGNVYSQFKKQSNYKPPHRSPYNISLRKGSEVGDFVLTARVLSTHPDYGHRDACLFFGYQNESQFYYVHLGKKADDHANQIFIVNNAPRTKISEKSTDGTDWDDDWHTVKIVRETKTGLIEVYYDNMEEPVMVAHDKNFVTGRIGVGSFDDTTDWDDIELRGTK